MKRRQWEWHLKGWFILLTIGRSWGLGFFVVPYNGPDIYLGPIVLTIQPPSAYQ